MPHKRNLGVLRHAAAFLSFPFSGYRSSPSFFSFLLSFLLSPFLRMPSFMRGAFSFFLLPLKKRKKTDASLSLCPSFLRKRKKKGMPQTRENSAFRNGKGKEEETDVLGIRFLPPGRQNFACDSDFRKRRDSLSCSMKKLSKKQI